MKLTARNQLALAFGAIAVSAGNVILTARARGGATHKKADGSPVTEADLAADDFIRGRLPGVVPGIVVITEETFDAAEAHELPDRFILVDPLDGTREFAAGRDEFTVNIALVEGGVPVAGVVYAPATSQLYVGGSEAFSAQVRPDAAVPGLAAMRRLSTSAVPRSGMRAIASRSHLDPATRQWLEERRIAEFCPAGSSLKFCKVAEGGADVYPRLFPTMEWVTAAGGCVLDLDGAPLRYGKIEQQLRNGAFVAWGRRPTP